VVDGRGEDEPACLHPDITKGRPGSRLPHAWLGHDKSTFDWTADGFALLMGPEGIEWVEACSQACQRLGLSLNGTRLPQDALDKFGIGPTGAVLARPDGFIAWRAADDSGAASGELEAALKQILAR
jgi:hypothetical protein